MLGFFKKKESQPPPFQPSPFVNDGNPIHQAIIGVKKGDKTQVFRLFDALATTPVILLLGELGKMETCSAQSWQKTANIVVFTRSEFISREQIESHPHSIQVLVQQVLSAINNDAIGLLINPGHPDVGIPIPPPLLKVFRDAVAAGSPTPVLGGLYHVRNEDGTFSVLKILKLDDNGVHICQYSNQYPAPPSAVDESTLYMVGVDRKPEEKLGMGHLPISKKSFAGWNASFFQQSSISEDELEGYKVWLEAKGGYF